MSKKLLLLIPMMLLVFSGPVKAQEDILPGAGITPDSPFYFLDRFGEAVQRLFTFGEEGEARLRIRFAEERVSEIRLMVESKGVDARGLEVAELRLRQHIADIDDILDDSDSDIEIKDEIRVAAERALGKASDLLDEEDEVEDMFDDIEDELEDTEDDLKRLLEEALSEGDSVRAEEIRGQLSDVQFQLDLLDVEEDMAKKLENGDVGDINDSIEEIFDAEKEIVAAEERIAREVMEGSDVSEATRLLDSAKEYLTRAYEAQEAGDYALAEELAESSKDLANESREGEYFDSVDDSDDIEDIDEIDSDDDDDRNKIDDDDDRDDDRDETGDSDDSTDDEDDDDRDDDMSFNFRDSIGLMATPFSPFMILLFQ